MRRTAPVAGLLFCSGACALIYQTVWMRQFRLIFGASTLATAAVLSIFMAGLGIGSALLGKRADVHPQPLRFYGNLELSIAATAALSQPLLWLIARIYFGIGGSVTLGVFFATIARLILAALVLAAPTILMGGTLPAVARAVESNDDAGRRRVALLYGVNTLGAVIGTLASTFFMLETLGNRRTLIVAVLLNALVGMVARNLAPSPDPAPRDHPLPAERGEGRGEGALVLTAAAIVGFTFLLMELVWYRMLAPLLGGTTFTFGLILAVALLGIGLGGAAYAFWGGSTRATVGGFALTCSLEALAIAIPFALGDRLAIQTNLLRSLGVIGFSGFLISWTYVTLLVVFPAAFIAGIQFPVLISLLGRGEEEVGRQVGLAYAWNTAGAIAGSLAGGFGLLPLLTAPGAWRVSIVLLALLGIAAAALSRRASPAIIALLAIGGTFALGPTASWRHSGIGAGRAETPDSVNGTREWVYSSRRELVWDFDGRESSVALLDSNDYAFIVNGKADGSARGDAGTQVMAGMVGAILHPNPQRALVIGLGTGSTAGWLGAISTMQRVDVVELEPAVIGVARACWAVNHDVLHNPKVHIRIADAREVLLAARDKYDIIFSEPSNPYRAGIASLFTEEFYRASEGRLNPNGIFLQWLQAYDVDTETIRTVYATMVGVFPHVETWITDTGDLLLVATRNPIRYDGDFLRRKIATEPFRSALTHAWRVESAEGFLAHFVARDSLARTLATQQPERNTDDRTLIEFGFARGLGIGRFNVDELAALARNRNEDRPDRMLGSIDWDVWASNRATIHHINVLAKVSAEIDQARHRAVVEYHNGNLARVLAEWRAHSWPPVNSGELMMLAESLADGGSGAAAAYADQLRPWQATDADMVLARLQFRQGKIDQAAASLERVFLRSRTDPWPTSAAFDRSLDLAVLIAKNHLYAQRMFRALEKPFAAGQWNDTRKFFRMTIANQMEGCGPHTVAALHDLEPWPPWRRELLTLRRDCYGSSMLTALAKRAQRDLNDFIAAEPKPLLAPTQSPSESSSNPQ
ncbi:MAG TPA: fused MFS/spermidine synthase [Thermoanaerobaculia bacterium]|nr:fused MFS/spermidine synthase [Thermoanaerobaculia bacterium]